MANDKTLFADIGTTAQALKHQIRSGRQWDDLSPAAKESLDQIATAIARIVSGESDWELIINFARAAKPEAPAPLEIEREMRRLVREIPKASPDAS